MLPSSTDTVLATTRATSTRPAPLAEDVRRPGRFRRAHQQGLALPRGPAGVLLSDDRGRAGHVRGGHRGAGEAHVALRGRGADLAVRGAAATMSTPGRGDVRLDRVVADPGAATGEVGQLVLVVHRADGERGVGAARRADRRGPPRRLPAAITNRAPCAAVSSSTACSSGSMLGESPPPRLMLMTGAAPRRPLHAGQDRRLLADSVSHTLPIASFAPGATPRYLPPLPRRCRR